MEQVCQFISFHLPGMPLPPADLAALRTVLGGVPALRPALLHTPAAAHDPYLHDGAPPALVLQLYFDRVTELEAAQASLLGLHAALPSLEAARVTQQAMLVRRFPVAAPAAAAAPCCTYLVAYEGIAEDPNAWLAHYLAHHTPIMARFPAIRQIEVYTRIDWISTLPYPVLAFLQRNKVVFDSPEALTAALHSPVRHEMRADYHSLPPYAGPVTHFPMWTETLA